MADTGSLTTGQAANIDRRLDDGAPITGTIVAENGCNTGTPEVYNETSAVLTCSVAYRIQ